MVRPDESMGVRREQTSQPDTTQSSSTSSRSQTPTGGSAGITVSTRPLTSTEDLTVTRGNAGGFEPQLFMRSDEPVGSNPIDYAPITRLNVNAAQDNYDPVAAAGMSAHRPEIISLLSFLPAQSSAAAALGTSNDSPVAEMLDVQLSARQLRAENIALLITELKENEETSAFIDGLEARLANDEAAAERDVTFLKSVVGSLATMKSALSIHPSNAALSSLGDPFRDIMVDILGFSSDGLKEFTTTKILFQVLDGLVFLLNSYSFDTQAVFDASRSADRDPFAIRSITDRTGNAATAFDVSVLRSSDSNDVRSVLSQSGLEDFQQAISQLSDDERLRMLFAVVSKELRVSAGLSLPVIRQSLEFAFGVTDPTIDVFERIVGVPGRSVFESPSGVQNSLASLFHLRTADGQIILPFEQAFISGPRDSVVVPGSEFYVDSILRGVQKLNTDPLDGYATALGTVIKSLASIVEGTLDVNAINSEELGLNADDMFDRFLRIVHGMIEELLEGPPIYRDAFIAALFHAAHTDPLLKHMIVLYVLFAGIDGSFQQESQDQFFKTMVSATGLDNVNVSSAIRDVASSYTFRSAPQGRNTSGTADSDFNRLLSGRSTTSTGGNVSSVGLDVISALIIERVFQTQIRTGAAGRDPGSERVQDRAVYDRMTTLGAGDPHYLLRSIVQFISSLDSLARSPIPGRDATYFSDDDPGLTKFNGLGAHMMLWMVIEMFTTFFSAFPITTFNGTEHSSSRLNSRFFNISRPVADVEEIKQALDRVLVSSGVTSARSGATAATALGGTLGERELRIRGYADRLRSIRKTFAAEDSNIRDIVRAFVALGKGVEEAAESVATTLSSTGPNAAVIQEMLAGPDADEKLAVLDEAQVVLARNILIEHRAGRASGQRAAGDNPTPFIDDTSISAGVRDALFSMLREPQFTAPSANNLNVLSVGMPSGLTRTLVGDPRVSSASPSFQEGVIALRVYMRDMLHDDIIFHPKTFLFETDRFVTGFDFENVNVRKDFEGLVRSVVRTRVLSSDSSSFVTELGRDAARSSSYAGVFKNDDERLSMVRNHVVSYLLQTYMRLMTGLDMSEGAFLLSDAVSTLRVDDQTRVEFEKLLTTHVSGLAGRRVTLDDLSASRFDVRALLSRLLEDEVLAASLDPLRVTIDGVSDQASIEIADDLVTFMKMFTPSSTLVGSGARRLRVTSPKVFERIFHVPVDPEEFEIDQAATAATQSGRAFLSTGGLAAYGLGDLTFRQFFVTIERLPKRQQRSQRPQDAPVERTSSAQKPKDPNAHIASSPASAAARDASGALAFNAGQPKLATNAADGPTRGTASGVGRPLI